MKALEVIVYSCFVQISVFIRSTESHFVNYGFFYGNSSPSRPNNSGRSIGGFSDVAQDIKMGQNCQIASFCKIASGCSMGDNVRVNNYVQVGQGTSIGSNCQIMDYASLGPYVTMGANNLMNQHAQIQQNADIGSGCIMCMHANVGPSTKLERNVYAGDHCQIGSNAVIGENSIIQPYAVVPDNGFVGPDEMVIKTPTTSQLYQNCLPVDQIQQSDIDLASHGQPEQLNERVRQLMSYQKQNMESSCQGYAQSVDGEPLSVGISLYLIRYDGLDQFIENMRRGGVFALADFGTSEIYINGIRVLGSSPSNGNDKHFVEGSPKKFLEPELENDMIEMLALKEDSQRSNRVPGDTFCKTVSEVQSKRKKVKCDQAVNVGSPGQNVPKTPVGRPEIPSQGSGNGHPVNNPPQSNYYQPNIGGQQPLQPNPQPSHSQQPNPQPSHSQQPNHGYSNNPNGNYPNHPKFSKEQPTTNVPNYSMTPNTNNRNNQFPNGQHLRPNYSYNNNPNSNQSTQPTTEGYKAPTPSYSNNQPTTQRTNQPTSGYHSTNSIPNNRASATRPNPNAHNMPQNPYSPPSTLHNNQPNYPSNSHWGHQPRPKQPNSGNLPNCNQCNIQPDISFGDNIEFGNNLNIGKSSTIGNNCKIKDNANVGDGVMIGSDSVVSENANIGSHCILDDKSKVGPNAKIEPRAYLGKNCDVGANAFVGENSIILDNAKVPDGGYIESNNIVIPTPTSADLYSSCAPIQKVPQNLISQPDPNNNLRQMMREQIAKVGSHCQRQSQQLLDFATLASAKTIYLISLHGIPSFSKNLQNVQHKASGNGSYDANAYEKLMNEEHFIDNSPSRIEPDVKGEMIILMAIEQDYARGNRSPDDSFCQTFIDIASNQRRVKCDK